MTSRYKFLSFAPPRYALSIAHFIPLESYWLKTKRVVLNRKEETGFASILDPEWTGLSGSGFRFQSSRRLDPQRWRNVDVRGNTRCPVCVLCNEAGVAHSTRVPPREEGEKAGEGWAMRGRRGGGEGGTGEHKGRCVWTDTRHSCFPSPTIRPLRLPSPWNTAAVSLLPSPPPTFHAPDSLCFVLTPFFPPFFFVSFHNGGLPPSTPSTLASWPLVLGRGLKCHSFSSCARFHAPKESLPPPFLSLHFFFSLSLCSLLSSPIYPSIRSALCSGFRRPSNSCPGEATKPGENGGMERGGSRDLWFSWYWKW